MKSPNPYCGAILAAGRGSRMQPFSERHPKPLLPVCNSPLIVHQIETMRAMGIRRIVVLIGHKGFEISKVLGDGSRLGVELRYVEQTAALGIAHAVGRLEPEIDGPVLLFLGDIYFVPDRLERMMDLFEEQGGGAILATKEEQDPEAIRRNFSMNVSPDGWVTRVIEKPRHATNKLKGVGIYLFDPSIFDAIRRTPRTALRDEYELTDAIQVMIDDGNRVRPANVIEQDINLTNPADLLRCNLLHASRMLQEVVIGSGTFIHPQAKITNSVIGSNVTVEGPVRIENSLVFDDTRVEAEGDFDRVIFTPDGLVDCQYFATEMKLTRLARKEVAAI
jgi:NDP-sugar pyrophosphorylase family protein